MQVAEHVVEGWKAGRGFAGSEERPVRVQAATGPDGAAGLR